jgi:hypothetical protein
MRFKDRGHLPRHGVLLRKMSLRMYCKLKTFEGIARCKMILTVCKFQFALIATN